MCERTFGLSIAVIGGLVVGGLHAPAQAQIFTDPAAFDAANPGLNLIEFDPFGTPEGAPGDLFAGQGIVFGTDISTNPHPPSPFGVLIVDGPAYGLPSDAAIQFPGPNDDSLAIDFSTPVEAVGFNFGLFQGGGVDFIFRAYDAGDNILAETTLGMPSVSGGYDFVGFSDLGGAIARVHIIDQDIFDGNSFITVDDVRFGDPITACYADCDESGELDFFDFLCFQNEFAAGAAYADCDESGELDFFDFLCFQNEFAAGCP